MVNLGRTRQMDRSQAAKYLRVAQALHYADALSIAFREVKSVDGDHSMAVATLRHALGHRADEKQIRILESIIDQKSAASYQGRYYRIADATAVVRKLDSFAKWTLSLWEERP